MGVYLINRRHYHQKLIGLIVDDAFVKENELKISGNHLCFKKVESRRLQFDGKNTLVII